MVSAAEQIGEHEQEGEHRDDPDVPELGDRVEAACRDLAAAVVPPRRYGVVDVLDDRDPPHENGEDAEHEPAQYRHGKGERQQEAARDLSVETPREMAPHARVWLHRCADRECDFLCRPSRRSGTPVRAGCEDSEEPGGQRCGQVGN